MCVRIYYLCTLSANGLLQSSVETQVSGQLCELDLARSGRPSCTHSGHRRKRRSDKESYPQPQSHGNRQKRFGRSTPKPRHAQEVRMGRIHWRLASDKLELSTREAAVSSACARKVLTEYILTHVKNHTSKKPRSIMMGTKSIRASTCHAHSISFWWDDSQVGFQSQPEAAAVGIVLRVR